MTVAGEVSQPRSSQYARRLPHALSPQPEILLGGVLLVCLGLLHEAC